MDLTHTVEFFKEPKTARVERTITANLKGRVFFEGTYWPARVHETVGDIVTDHAFHVSSWVTVIGRQGLTLLVVPAVSVACA
jgi:membrane protein implicated in regulation of membrane protease activity